MKANVMVPARDAATDAFQFVIESDSSLTSMNWVRKFPRFKHFKKKGIGAILTNKKYQTSTSNEFLTQHRTLENILR